MNDATHSSAQTSTRDAIVDAAARLLHEGGTDAVTTRGVAKSAGVQPPTIYRLFGDKDGLLDAVAERVMERFVDAKSALVDAAVADKRDPVDDLRAGWETQIEFGLANPVLFTLANTPGRGASSPAAQAGVTILRRRIHRVAASGRLRVSEQRAVDLFRSAGAGTVLTLVTTRPEDRDTELPTAMLEAVLREIVVDAPEQPDGTHAATTIAFRAIASELPALSDAERRLLIEWLDRSIDSAES